MRLPWFGVLSFGFVLGCLVSCDTGGDLNQPCELVKSGPDGGAVPLTEGELPTSHTDFISFGSPDCDALLCVRDADYPRDADGGVAYGYCSVACTPGANSDQCQSYDSSLDSDKAACGSPADCKVTAQCLNGLCQTQLNCRALLLDATTLQAICANDAGACQELFNGQSEPFFCARGTTPDGGV
jgi:hypothetical protein